MSAAALYCAGCGQRLYPSGKHVDAGILEDSNGPHDTTQAVETPPVSSEADDYQTASDAVLAKLAEGPSSGMRVVDIVAAMLLRGTKYRGRAFGWTAHDVSTAMVPLRAQRKVISQRAGTGLSHRYKLRLAAIALLESKSNA